MIRAVIAVVLVAVAVVVIVLVAPSVGEVSGGALSHSVARHLDGSSVLPCGSRDANMWDCAIETDGGSAGEPWRVRLDGRCWDASPGGPREVSPTRQGCVGLRDQLRPVDRLLSSPDDEDAGFICDRGFRPADWREERLKTGRSIASCNWMVGWREGSVLRALGKPTERNGPHLTWGLGPSDTGIGPRCWVLTLRQDGRHGPVAQADIDDTAC
jgi:hypothetical protein